MNRFLDYFQVTEYLGRFRFLNAVFTRGMYFLLKFFRVLRSKKGCGGVLIVSINKLGDTVFTFPAINAINEYYHDKKITILCYETGKEIYEYFFKQFNTVLVEKKMFHMGARVPGITAIKILKQLDPEIIIDLTGCMTSASLFPFSRAKEINGINKEVFRGLYDNFVPVRNTPTLIDSYLDAVSYFISDYDKLKNKIYQPSFRTDDKILIHPFAGWRAKEWGIKKFIQLAQELKKEYKVEMVVEPGSLNNEIRDELEDSGIPVIETKSILELLINIENCSLMISNDTGCIYLSAALGKATYTIYGPTNPEYSAPEGYNHRTIRKIINCSPMVNQYCFTFGGQVGCPSFQCMFNLSENEVLSDVRELISKTGIKSRNE